MFPPGRAACRFDFRFLSAEYPNRVGAQFNDAFIAELVPLNTPSAWTATGGSLANLQNDFAVDAQGQPKTVNAMGSASMSPAEAAGTPYGGATAPLLPPATRSRSLSDSSPSAAAYGMIT